MNEKEKEHRTRLSYSQKGEVLRLLKEGKSPIEIQKQFGISARTFILITKNEEEIITKAENFEMKNRRTKRSAVSAELEDAMYIWFCQKRIRGEPVSGPLVKEQALIFNKKLNGDFEFKASNGWLCRFKNRHGIRECNMKGETFSNDEAAANEFKEVIKNKIAREKLSLNNIYNADETGLYWRCLPQNSSYEDEQVFEREESEDRVSMLFCANANGTHRLPLLMIGKSAKPRWFKHETKLPVEYISQTKGWMDRNIFTKWYTDSFIPCVINHQKEQNISGKVLLILDNAPSHPPSSVLNQINPNFEVLYLPPNVAPILQPMDQGVIANVKKLYKKSLLRKLLLQNETVEVFLKSINLRDCAQMSSAGWEEIESYTLKKIWHPLLEEESVPAVDIKDEPLDFSAEISERLDIDEVQLNNWFDDVNTDHGWESLDTDQIIHLVTSNNHCVEYTEENSDDGDKKSNDTALELAVPNLDAKEVLKNVQSYYDWLQVQDDCETSILINMSSVIEYLKKKLSSF